jgi:hypothetical protein
VTDPSPLDPVDTGEEGETSRRSRRSRAETDGGASPGLWGRRRLVILLGAAVAVLVIVAAALLLTQGRGQQEPLTVETTTVVGPPPTPAEDPIERDTSTALLAALPGAVLGYAVSEQVESAAMLELEALEGWQLTYSSTGSEVVLQVGQWSTAAESSAAATSLLGDATATESGDVLVGGEAVGTFTTVAVDETTERTIWTNATVTFVIEGPSGSTRTFYDAFPL